MTTTSPRRATWRSPLLALAILGSALAACADYTPQVVLIPREGHGKGTLSAYAGFTPVFEPSFTGDDAIKLPASSASEINLVWTFWRHTQPSADQWPASDKGRSVFTLTSDADATLRLRITFRSADEWVPFTELPELVVKAGEPVKVVLPLAPHDSLNQVDCIRIIFNASMSIPELTVTDWSIGTE